MNCPACSYFNPVGAQTCFHCGLALPVGAPGARCATHPDVEAAGACSRCGTFSCGACLTQRELEWICATCAQRRRLLPWDERGARGVWSAWWRTAAQLISTPTDALRDVEPAGPLRGSFFFATLCVLAGVSVPSALAAVGMVVTVLGAPEGERDAAAAGGLLLVAGVIAGLALQAFLFIALSGVEHVLLRWAGATEHPWSVTVRAHALASAAWLAGLVPGCGLPVAALWFVVLKIIAMRALHRTSLGAAVAVVLLPALFSCGLLGAAAALMAVSAGSRG